MKTRMIRSSAIALKSSICVCLIVTAGCNRQPELRLKTYFHSAGGLRPGAPVRVQGVDLGKVEAVRVRPELGGAPVEIEMVLKPPYALKIPAGAKVHLETAGVLGETFAAIDVVGASGGPVTNNAVLQAQPAVELTTEQLLERLGELIRKSCKDDSDPPVPAERAPKARGRSD